MQLQVCCQIIIVFKILFVVKHLFFHRSRFRIVVWGLVLWRRMRSRLPTCHRCVISLEVVHPARYVTAGRDQKAPYQV